MDKRDDIVSDYDSRIELSYKLLESCRVCPHLCKVNRLKGQHGLCGMGKDLVVSSFGPHFGEEVELVGPKLSDLQGCCAS